MATTIKDIDNVESQELLNFFDANKYAVLNSENTNIKITSDKSKMIRLLKFTIANPEYWNLMQTTNQAEKWPQFYRTKR